MKDRERERERERERAGREKDDVGNNIVLIIIEIMINLINCCIN